MRLAAMLHCEQRPIAGGFGPKESCRTLVFPSSRRNLPYSLCCFSFFHPRFSPRRSIELLTTEASQGSREVATKSGNALGVILPSSMTADVFRLDENFALLGEFHNLLKLRLQCFCP